MVKPLHFSVLTEVFVSEGSVRLPLLAQFGDLLALGDEVAGPSRTNFFLMLDPRQYLRLLLWER